MDIPKLKVFSRTRTGKGPARRLRAKGLVPVVLYGKGVETISLSVVPKELVQALSGPLHTNTVLELDAESVDKKASTTYHAMVRDHQFDPVSRDLVHVDFVTVELGKKLQVKVPFRPLGRSVGELAGGKLVIVFRELLMECLPENIPVEIVADISALDLNEGLTIADLELPESAEMMIPLDTTVVVVQTAKIEEEETEEEEGEEGEEGEDGEKAEGDKAEGDKAEGDKAEGDKAEGDKGKGDKGKGDKGKGKGK